MEVSREPLPYPYSVVAAFVCDQENGLSRNARKLLRSLLEFAALRGRENEAPFEGREEANALVAYCFRNTHLENLHCGLKFTDAQMKKLMLEATEKVRVWLEIRDFMTKRGPRAYRVLVHAYRDAYTANWRR